jgi:hypothetical protein
VIKALRPRHDCINAFICYYAETQRAAGDLSPDVGQDLLRLHLGPREASLPDRDRFEQALGGFKLRR